MKKTIALILVLLLALCACAESMIVVNCSEWTALRDKTTTPYERLKKVPLGAIVDNCAPADNGFTYCEYNGIAGYILTENLESLASEAVEDPAETDLVMTVVNCTEYASLRDKPMNPSERLAKVPVGATVTNCMVYNEEYTYCEYDGHCGYILNEYLAVPGEEDMAAPADAEEVEEITDVEVPVDEIEDDAEPDDIETVAVTEEVVEEAEEIEEAEETETVEAVESVEEVEPVEEPVEAEEAEVVEEVEEIIEVETPADESDYVFNGNRFAASLGDFLSTVLRYELQQITG